MLIYPFYQDDVGWCGGATAVTGAPGDAPQSPNNSATSSRSSGCDSNPEEQCQPHPGMRGNKYDALDV